jgi:hypothetical protein
MYCKYIAEISELDFLYGMFFIEVHRLLQILELHIVLREI